MNFHQFEHHTKVLENVGGFPRSPRQTSDGAVAFAVLFGGFLPNRIGRVRRGLRVLGGGHPGPPFTRQRVVNYD
jgi:hypothetical protein